MIWAVGMGAGFAAGLRQEVATPQLPGPDGRGTTWPWAHPPDGRGPQRCARKRRLLPTRNLAEAWLMPQFVGGSWLGGWGLGQLHRRYQTDTSPWIGPPQPSSDRGQWAADTWSL
ncbi:cbp/p300-interacting transactivator 1 [Platysternon megacephalum]|uniref:Cbp/p300-interacting transactivator 1 n=1 Tax=Platysternon megacephalum TaxID=55544 RepID=A0A4D9DN87_9SAUR|nr:cbp/p300-interacting transactivator 1 [Platysternon megacephalum]